VIPRCPCAGRERDTAHCKTAPASLGLTPIRSADDTSPTTAAPGADVIPGR
jgi:hypothetical protein